jgi:MFS family permease
VSLVGLLLLFESSLYSAVTPVLPHYAHTLHLGKPAVGVLAAAYPAGLIPGALIGGWIAARAGVRRTTMAGLAVFGAAIAAFGFATDIASLDALRAIQGAVCGLIWGGGLTWAIAVSPRERRGATIGTVIAAATFGTLLGPLLGTIAVALGTGPVFCAVGCVSVGLAMATLREAEPAAPVDEEEAPTSDLRAALRGGLALGTWLILVEAITIGATNALLPLRLARLGASGVAIGATFVAAAAVASVFSPIAGRVTDRHGTRTPVVIGLVCGAALLGALLLAHSWPVLAVLCVVALGAPLTGYMIPAVSMMTASAERAGIALLFATTLVNLGYAIGETIGAPAAAAASAATSDAVPILGLSALMVLTLWPVLRGSAGPPPGGPDARHPEPRRGPRRRRVNRRPAGDRAATGERPLSPRRAPR